MWRALASDIMAARVDYPIPPFGFSRRGSKNGEQTIYTPMCSVQFEL